MMANIETQTRRLKQFIRLRLFAAGIVVLSTPGIAQTTIAKPSSAPAKQPPCADAVHHQFDFWIGKWDVVNTADHKPAGSSLIESLYGGCALRENWRETGFSGGSLNTYNMTDKRWHQTWTDSAGTWREFVGGIESGKMILVWRHASVKFPGKTVQERMIFSHNLDGSVRQYSDQSLDGVKWIMRYDYTYRRAKA